jgi:hypothetical protein
VQALAYSYTEGDDANGRAGDRKGVRHL